MKHSLSHGILVCATALSLGACGAQPATVPSTPAPPTYVERVQERLQEVAERDLHELRYNPGLCGCPPFELKLQERWHRLTFDVADDSHPVLVELRADVNLQYRRPSGASSSWGAALDGCTPLHLACRAGPPASEPAFRVGRGPTGWRR